jgi:hypothetical protein
MDHHVMDTRTNSLGGWSLVRRSYCSSFLRGQESIPITNMDPRLRRRGEVDQAYLID